MVNVLSNKWLILKYYKSLSKLKSAPSECINIVYMKKNKTTCNSCINFEFINDGKSNKCEKCIYTY